MGRWTFALVSLLSLLPVPYALAEDAPPMGETLKTHAIERRRDQFSKDFAYFVYPIAGSIPGLGTASGFGATLANIKETDLDFTGFFITGDFAASGVALTDLHLIHERLVVNFGAYTYDVAPLRFRRGMDSDKNDYILPNFEGASNVAQVALTFDERRWEFYARFVNSSGKLKRVLDKNGVPYANIDQSLQTENSINLGFGADMTDDIQDPRHGYRVEGVRRTSFNRQYLQSAFDQYALNFTGYVPVGAASTWAFNAFYSAAAITSQATTDRTELRNAIGFNCGAIPDPTASAQCTATENQFLDDRIAYNKYGYAVPMGGTQRMRAYPNGRYMAGKSIFYGTEFRLNLTEERTLMDWFILRGVRTNLQAAFFAEVGSVADTDGDLHRKLRPSYGAGFRALFSGVTIRLDFALGDEGSAMQLFLDYPWSLFSVDNPG